MGERIDRLFGDAARGAAYTGPSIALAIVWFQADRFTLVNDVNVRFLALLPVPAIALLGSTLVSSPWREHLRYGVAIAALILIGTLLLAGMMGPLVASDVLVTAGHSVAAWVAWTLGTRLRSRAAASRLELLKRSTGMPEEADER